MVKTCQGYTSFRKVALPWENPSTDPQFQILTLVLTCISENLTLQTIQNRKRNRNKFIADTGQKECR